MSVLPQSARRLAASRRRLATATAAIGFAVALGTTGCGAGQVSQTANQLPAVNGANADVENQQLALRNVQVLYPTEEAAEIFGEGGPFELTFVISTSDQVHDFRLTRIEPEEGTVTLEPSSPEELLITPDKALRAGAPVGIFAGEDESRNEYETMIEATLDDAGESVAMGLTTSLTFYFEKQDSSGNWVDGGSVEVLTPVDAGATMDRQDQIRQAEVPPGEADHGEGGH